MDPFADLLARASVEIAGADANQALWNVRAEIEQEYGSAVLYEVVIPESEVWSRFLAHAIPRVTEHLSAKGLSMLGGPAAVISVWHGANLYIFESLAFFAAVQAIEGLDEAGLWRRIGEWREALGLSIPRESLLAMDRHATPRERALATLPAPSSSSSE